MDKEKKLPESLEKKHTPKPPIHRSPFTQNKLLISVIIFLVLLVLVVFIQKPQIFIQRAATNQASSSAVNNCSPVPFYCLILGGSKTCTQPKVCPTLAPAQGFVPQSNPQTNPQPATNPPPQATDSGNTNNASGSACLKPPAVLTTKLIIHFDTDAGSNNGYTIRSADMPALNKYAAALKDFPSATVTIDGYTDNVPFAPGTAGPINTNQALSLARAQAAEKYLQDKGASANEYIAKGLGATNFVAPNDPQNGNILNRRDEITTDLKANTCIPKVASTAAQPVCGTSPNWSGYVIKKLPPTAQQTYISTDWKVSAVTCPGNAFGISQWPGIEGGKPGWLAQTGTYSACPKGKTNYFAWSFILTRDKVFTGLPQNKYPVKPGDQFSATMNMTSPGHITAVLDNQTQRWSYTRNMTITTPGTLVDAESIFENEDSGKVALPNFNPATTTFTNNMFSIGKTSIQPLIQAPGLTCLNLQAGKVQQDAISNLNNSSFDVTFKHN